MICPEDFFTPKSLETAFAKSLDFALVRQTVFASAKQPLDTIPAPQMGCVLQASASVFLHFFIKQFSHEARVYDQDTKAVHRIDEWALTVTSGLPTSLPKNAKQATSREALLGSRFVFFDQELWVLDCERLANLDERDAAIERITKLVHGLDGCSLCFPVSIFPDDPGAAMNALAKGMAERIATDMPAKAKAGRPKKIDKVVAILKRHYPNGFGHELQKQVLRTVKKELNESIGMTTLRNAMTQVTDENETENGSVTV